jgi:hypothetical protein
MISDRFLYLTKDRSRVVEAGDEEAAILLVGEGGFLADADAIRYGLMEAPPAPETRTLAGLVGEGGAKAIASAPENKAVTGPDATKTAEGGENDDDELVAGTVPEVVERVEAATTAEELDRIEAAENDREIPRKGVLSAVEAKRAELESADTE